jgi:acetyl-CoA carboxylase biotin carboxyl carrier protein
VNLDDVRQILALMRDNGLSEFEIEHEGLRLRIRKDTVAAGGAALPPGGVAPMVVTAVPPAALSGAPAGAQAAASTQGAQPGPQPAEEIELAVVKSPIVGTFYRSSEPSAPPFVEIGARVKKGQVLCIIEAMKLMNEIDSEYDGEIINVYVENGQPVQYGERLFAIRTT